MCTPFAHGLAGYAVIALGEPRLTADFRGNLKAMGAGFVFGSMADADFLVAYLTHHPVLQHHYFSHSVPFVLVVGVLTYMVLRFLLKTRVFRATLILTGAYATHLLLDYFTHDGKPPIGIPLAWPLTHEHFVAPVQIFLSIHRGSIHALFGPHNFLALFREALILGPLALLAYRKAISNVRRESHPQL